MYKLVFLLIFSAANVTGAKDITLDINTKSETEPSCHVTPNGPQILTEGENIRFHIQTPTKLNDFWCFNEGIIMYNLNTAGQRHPLKSHGKMKYTLAETSTDSDMKGNWTCTYQIANIKNESIEKKHENTCLFQVKVTTPPKLSIASSVALRQWNDKTYNYSFTDGETIDLNCSLKDAAEYEKKYDIVFYEQSKSVASSKESNTTTHVWHNFTLNEESKIISCAAFEDRVEKSRIVVRLHCNPRPTQGSGVKLTIEELPNNSCAYVGKGNFRQICHYTYDQDRIGNIGMPPTLTCVLGGSTYEDSDWIVKFGHNSSNATFKKDGSSPIIVSYDIPPKNNTVTCNATKTTGKVMTINVTVYYLPQSTTTHYNTMEPTTEQRIVPPQVNSTVPVSQSSGEDWLKWVLGAGALLITICVVVGCLVKYRQKKPPPADSTFANLSKDQSKPLPMPAPRTIQKTNDGQKPNAARKPNAALENNYSEPKDSQDMSEALYADPNRFVGDSSNYAEPYVAKPNPCDTYAEPYKSNYAEPYPCTSEGNYAELNLPDSSIKELYAKPIPKAQRKPKPKDDCNYSTVRFT